MPTAKPRLNITLEPHRYALIKRYAELQGVPMAKVITGFMELTYDAVESLCAMMEGVEIADNQVRNGFKGSLEQAEKDILKAAFRRISQFDLFLSSGGETENPRLVTTGDSTPSDPHSTVN